MTGIHEEPISWLRIIIWVVVGLVILSGVLWIGMIIGEDKGRAYLPTIREFQARIGCQKIDGKLGPMWLDSETQEHWEQAYETKYGIWMY